MLEKVALLGLLVLIAALAIEHLLNPSIDPLEHQVSEYVRTDSGALMFVGFAAWSLSLTATGTLARRCGDRVLATLFAFSAFGMALVTLFPTQTRAGELPPGSTLTLTGHLHDLGSGLTTLALTGAATWTLFAARSGRSLRIVSAVLLIGALVISVALLVIGPPVGGLRQRLLLLTGWIWQLIFLHSLRVSAQTTAGILRAGSARARGSC